MPSIANSKIVLCPQCDEPMTLRNSARGQFWGCIRFPLCRGTRNVGEETKAQPKLQSKYTPIVKMPGTDEQEAIWDYLLHGTAHVVVNAGPGTGKTWSILQYCLRALKTQRIQVTCFGKPIEREMSGKMLASGLGNVAVKTSHSWGNKVVRSAFKNLGEPDENKMTAILEQLFPAPLIGRAEWRRKINLADKLCGYVKNYLIDYRAANFRARMEEIVDHHNIDANGSFDLAIDLIPRALDVCKERAGVSIDFDDMVYLPVVLNLPVPNYLTSEMTFIDECLIGETPILLADRQTKTIRDLVESRYNGKVLAYEDGKTVERRVIGWHMIPVGKPMVRIITRRIGYRKDGIRLFPLTEQVRFWRRYVVCTADHKLLANGKWTSASGLKTGDKLVEESYAPHDRHFQDICKIGDKGRADLARQESMGDRFGTSHRKQVLAGKKGDLLHERLYNSPVESEIISVEPWVPKDPYVYDITVEGAHNYYAHGVLVHNCQDINALQHELVMKMIGKDGRACIVGDFRQAIYEFRGAASNSMDVMAARFEATPRGVKRFPMNITQRCPKLHVRMAQALFPDIQALDDAPMGGIQSLKEEKALLEMKPGDLVICRCNAPLIAAAYSLIRRGVRPVVKGRDIGKGLLSLIGTLENAASVIPLTKPCPNCAGKGFVNMSGTVNDAFEGSDRDPACRCLVCSGTGTVKDEMGRMREALNIYKYEQQQKLLPLGDKAQGRLTALDDKCDCLAEFLSNSKTVAEMTAKITSLFQLDRKEGEEDESDAVILGTVHRTKGLEAWRVFVLAPDLIPHPAARKRWEHESERCIAWIASTRAKFDRTGKNGDGTIIFCGKIPPIYSQQPYPAPEPEEPEREVTEPEETPGIQPGIAPIPASSGFDSPQAPPTQPPAKKARAKKATSDLRRLGKVLDRQKEESDECPF